MTLSPDGLWWWNGTQWVSAVSPDGHWRWDGRHWLPNKRQSAPVQHRFLRVPTLETRPLQFAVVAYLVISGAINLFVIATTEATMLRGLPNFQSDTAAGQAAMNAIVNTSVAGGITFTLLWNSLMVVGTLLRWRWTYYVLMIFGFLSVFAVLADVVELTLNSQSDTAWVSFVGVFSGLVYVGLAFWMRRLWRERRTAWAMQYAAEPA